MKPHVVLVHGLGYGSWGWGPAAEALAADFRLVPVDTDGLASVAAMAEHVAAVMDEAGVARAHVVGTSLGGMVAQELAISFPERVDRLVLVCTTPGGGRAFPMPEQTVLLMREAASLPQQAALRLFVENALAGPELVEEIYRLRLAHPPDPDAWRAQATAGASFDALDRLAGVAAPTLVLHGTADVVVDPRNAELLAAAIPRARVERFPDAGHLLFWERPEDFARVVREFLAC